MEYFFREGCYITELWNREEDPEVSVARVRVLPGATTLWHSLCGITERYMILRGTALAETGTDRSMQVGQGDTVIIPPGVRQRITNTGSGELIFLAVCTPRFVAELYTEEG
jgi:mannose-6-phosphate isomerase-like protein (cupin superfamily)